MQPSDADRFRPIDVQRIRVADAFVDSGLAVEDLGRLVAEGHVTFPNLEAVFGKPISVSNTTFAEFAAEVDRDPDLLRRVYTQLNLPQPDDDDRLRADDLEFLRDFILVFDARDLGLGDDFLLRAARLCGDGIRRLVESVNSLMREELLPAMIRSSPGPLPMRGGGPFVATSRVADWLIRRHLEAVMHRNIVESIERVMEETGSAVAAISIRLRLRSSISRGSRGSRERRVTRRPPSSQCGFPTWCKRLRFRAMGGW